MEGQTPELASTTAESAAARPIFEALLYPRRSLGKRGYTILIAGTAAIVACYGAVFLFLGYWPVFGFLGGEWALFWYLFSRHYRGDDRKERIRLYADHLLFERHDARGRQVVERLQPYWLNVILEREAEPDNALYLRSHGRQIQVGAFLSPQERRDLARELREVLTRLRRPAFD
ncbi:MAG TPA: DUF2244 domain-containing protein [Candidatus Cybelea sp.]|nr:DUF2244 domain-containing protein [Candidatus Cybelea sp.]